MPTAILDLPSGTKVTIEGKQDEVAALLSILERGDGTQSSKPVETSGKPKKATPTALILELSAEGFFREPKELSDLNRALRAKGHFYPATTLSPVLLRLVRSRQLRRLKDAKRWKYVN